MAITIESGPFAGKKFESGTTYYVYPDEKIGGTPKIGVFMAELTRVFLQVFDPRLGWAVSIDSEMGGLQLTPLSHGNEVPSTQRSPTVRFIAKLVDPQGRAVVTASSLWTISQPTDWERGETNARQRLYEAAGLQTRFDIPETSTKDDQVPQGGTTRAEAVRPVVVKVPTRAAAPQQVEPSPEPAAVNSAEEPAAPASQEQQARADEAPAWADVTETGDSDLGAAPRTRRNKRARLPDDAEAPQGLLVAIERLCKARGLEVPQVTTKAEAKAVLEKLKVKE